MLDIKWIRENPQALVAALEKRPSYAGSAQSTVDDLIAKDEARREHLTELQARQERRNAASKEIGQAMAAKDAAKAEALKTEVAALKTYVDDNSMLLVSQSSTAGTLAIANDNVFRLTPSDTLEAVALVGVMNADGMKTIIPYWRNDAGNVGLQVATRALFSANGAVKAGVQYDAATTDFNSSLAALKTQVQAAIAERGGTAGVAVAHAGFDEVVEIFKLAAADPVLGSVRWYGTDGTALNEPLRANAVAAGFAKKVNFWTPTPGVDDAAKARWQPVAQRIAAKVGGAQPDAFALAVYDAVWITAQAYLAAGGTGHTAALKSAFVTAADAFYGASGWTKLNAAGDRQFGDFDFFALSQSGSSFTWGLAAQYNTQTGVLTRK